MKSFVWNSLAIVNQHLPLSVLAKDDTNAIIMYHSVGNSSLPANICPERLRRDLEFLTQEYHVVDLQEVLSNRQASEKKVALTFDDGYQNFYTTVFPILSEFDVPATVFVVSDFIGDCWEDPHRTETPRDNSSVMMTKSQLRELVDTNHVTLGNHTRTHPLLTNIAEEGCLESEILGAQRDLQEWFDVPINTFCYPYGDFNQDVIDVVRRSHEYALSVVPGLVDETVNPFALPRVSGHVSHARLKLEMSDFGNLVKQSYRSLIGSF